MKFGERNFWSEHRPCISTPSNPFCGFDLILTCHLAKREKRWHFVRGAQRASLFSCQDCFFFLSKRSSDLCLIDIDLFVKERWWSVWLWSYFLEFPWSGAGCGYCVKHELHCSKIEIMVWKKVKERELHNVVKISSCFSVRDDGANPLESWWTNAVKTLRMTAAVGK